MDLAEPPLAALDLAMRETALFAAFGFLLLGISYLAVDLVWIACALWRQGSPYVWTGFRSRLRPGGWRYSPLPGTKRR